MSTEATTQTNEQVSTKFNDLIEDKDEIDLTTPTKTYEPWQRWQVVHRT